MIEVRDLCKSFEGKKVLCNVSLQVEEGEKLAIIGRSGSGKSVLLKHMVGLLTPDEGSVLVDGKDLSKLSYRRLRDVRRQFGVLFQGGALFDSLTVFENVAFPLRTFTRKSEGEIGDRVEECLSLVKLPEARHKKPSEISGGMQKRVALARAIALEPRYVLYDEPTSGLDPQTSNTIDEVIHNLAECMNITSVVVTHDMHSVLAVADRVVFVHEGALHWTGSIRDLHQSDDPVLLAFVKANEYHIGEASLAAHTLS